MVLQEILVKRKEQGCKERVIPCDKNKEVVPMAIIILLLRRRKRKVHADFLLNVPFYKRAFL